MRAAAQATPLSATPTRNSSTLWKAPTSALFKMENVRAGVFNTAHKLFGLNFEQLDSIPVYHPDVEGFKVTDADGSLIGIFT